MAALLHADVSGSLLIKRYGSTVTARLNLKATVNKNRVNVFLCPMGFRPRGVYAPVGMALYDYTGTGLVFGPLDGSQMFLLQRSDAINTSFLLVGEVSWQTTDPFPLPAAYPGTPA